MTKQQGVQVDEAASKAQAWDKARIYADLLVRAGGAGRWTVGVELNAPASREGRQGRTGDARWRVVVYDERPPGEQSVASLYAALKLSRFGNTA